MLMSPPSGQRQSAVAPAGAGSSVKCASLRGAEDAREQQLALVDPCWKPVAGRLCGILAALRLCRGGLLVQSERAFRRSGGLRGVPSKMSRGREGARGDQARTTIRLCRELGVESAAASCSTNIGASGKQTYGGSPSRTGRAVTGRPMASRAPSILMAVVGSGLPVRHSGSVSASCEICLRKHY